MKEFSFETQVWLNRPRTEVFAFFSATCNLEAITPGWLNFHVLTSEPIQIQNGTVIDYRIRVHGIPFRWRTEISEWRPPESFVDVQLRGPYRLWHHTHTFVERDGGTLCGDVVRYSPPGGALVNWLFVGRDVRKIFQFRQQRLREIFA